MLKLLLDLIVGSTRYRIKLDCLTCGTSADFKTNSVDALRTVRSYWNTVHGSCPDGD